MKEIWMQLYIFFYPHGEVVLNARRRLSYIASAIPDYSYKIPRILAVNLSDFTWSSTYTNVPFFRSYLKSRINLLILVQVALVASCIEVMKIQFNHRLNQDNSRIKIQIQVRIIMSLVIYDIILLLLKAFKIVSR